MEFCDEYYYTLKTAIFKQKIPQKIIVLKWQPNDQFSFRVTSISAEIWKITFPKEFFDEIWLIVGDHECINIAEINLEIFIPVGFKEQNIFSYTLKMLLNAN